MATLFRVFFLSPLVFEEPIQSNSASCPKHQTGKGHLQLHAWETVNLYAAGVLYIINLTCHGVSFDV